MKVVLIIILEFFIHGEVFARSKNSDDFNDRPVIGILSQEQSSSDIYPEDNYTSFIVASYVKDVEASGARVVPLFIGRDRCYYKELMTKINGVLLPGGNSLFNETNGYADAGQHIYEIAKELNDAGKYFPLFGTCLGFQFLVILASGRGPVDNKISCNSFTNLPLSFVHDYSSSKMFKDVTSDSINIFMNKNITINAHHFCIVDENLISHNLTDDWRVTSYSYDDFNVMFIASIEHRRYPFYGVQFHPEKTSYEWMVSKYFVHSIEAVKVNRHFMDFFVRECRKNQNRFEDESELNRYVIYNYVPRFTDPLGSQFQQIYFFEPRETVSNTISI